MASYLHHSVVKKAAKLGVTMIDAGMGVFIATDTKNGDAKTEGTDGKALLEEVLAARPQTIQPAKVKKAPKAKKMKLDKSTGIKANVDAEDEDEEDTEETDAEDEDEEENKSGSIVRERYRAIYRESTVPNSNDDDLAGACHDYLTNDDGDLDLARLGKLARDNGLSLDRWSHLNNGQQRMCLGNALRGMLRKGKQVVVGTTAIKGQAQ